MLDTHLGTSRQWLVGDRPTIADYTTIGWVNSAEWAGVDINEFPNLKSWKERFVARPAVAKGLTVPPRVEQSHGKPNFSKCK